MIGSVEVSIYIVLLGPPGAGKGTQANVLASQFNLPHISSGDIFRENIKNESELGKKAKQYIDRGELVPDSLTINMIQDRLAKPDCKPGAVLDGFPRTPSQADALSDLLKEFEGEVNAVPYIMVPQEVLVERLTGRWTCVENGHVFHERFNSPKISGICDFDGSDLYQREDDKLETVTNRIKIYFQQTMPLIEYYRNAGLLLEIDGDQSIQAISQDILSKTSQRIMQ